MNWKSLLFVLYFIDSYLYLYHPYNYNRHNTSSNSTISITIAIRDFIIISSSSSSIISTRIGSIRYPSVTYIQRLLLLSTTTVIPVLAAVIHRPTLTVVGATVPSSSSSFHFPLSSSLLSTSFTVFHRNSLRQLRHTKFESICLRRLSCASTNHFMSQNEGNRQNESRLLLSQPRRSKRILSHPKLSMSDMNSEDDGVIRNMTSTAQTTIPVVPVTPSPPSPKAPFLKSKKRRTSTIPTAAAAATPPKVVAKNEPSVRNAVTPMECISSSLSPSPSSSSLFVAEDNEYHDLYIPPNELRPSRTLITGQCFNWRVVIPVLAAEANPSSESSSTTTTPLETTSNTTSAWGTHNAREWIGQLRVHHNSSSTEAETIIVMIREVPTTTLYRTIYSSDPTMNVREVLYAYFQITPSIPSPPFSSPPPEPQQKPPEQKVEYTNALFPMETTSSLDLYNNTATAGISNQNNKNKSNICLTDLYQEWSTQCDRMKVIASHLPGVRILDQDPFYCMISFLCSSNNNIPRITKMLSSLQRTYGTRFGTIPHSALLCREDQQTECKIIGKKVVGWEEQDIDPLTGDMIWYAFPSLQQLRNTISESDLRTRCGMGYRATYLMETIQLLHALGGERYLHELRNNSTDPIHVQEQLLQFKGIGRKVADCIALFSLQQHHAIPVDVHVWNIARRDYQADDFLIPSSSTLSSSSTTKTTTIQKTKSLTPTIYRQIGDLFRNKFPNYSGWAHSLLFVAELPSFRLALPEDIVNDMDAVRTDTTMYFALKIMLF